ncbi:hypothetical protein BJY59DRAFT_698979 [Rhodotorula toruloides]
MGVGIGGDYPLSSVITSEFAATRIRGRMMSRRDITHTSSPFADETSPRRPRLPLCLSRSFWSRVRQLARSGYKVRDGFRRPEILALSH